VNEPRRQVERGDRERPTPGRQTTGLPPAASVLAVCAHPDDESFGLGAALAAFGGAGAAVTVLSLTHGEASTLGTGAADLGLVRGAELAAAGRVLGVRRVALFDHPDGGLCDVPLEVLVREINGVVEDVRPDLLLVFDQEGVTGHPDHRRATEAAIATADVLDLPVLAWTIPQAVATQLNREFKAAFVGRPGGEIDVEIATDRTVQHKAIGCHESQSRDNPVLWRRLELAGDVEVFCWLRRGGPGAPSRRPGAGRAPAR